MHLRHFWTLSVGILIPGLVLGCGAKNPIINQLPQKDQTQINHALNGYQNFKLPAFLPFTPTDGTATVTSTLDRTAQVSLQLRLFNKNDIVVLHEVTGNVPVTNVPNTLKLKDGIRVAYKHRSDLSELYWSDGSQEYTLDSIAASQGASPLTKQQLLAIANSIE